VCRLRNFWSTHQRINLGYLVIKSCGQAMVAVPKAISQSFFNQVQGIDEGVPKPDTTQPFITAGILRGARANCLTVRFQLAQVASAPASFWLFSVNDPPLSALRHCSGGLCQIRSMHHNLKPF
jgi:hypothetical protein